MDSIPSLAERIEHIFRDIARTRMDGVPILHPGLTVAMRGLRLYGAHHVGVLVTPWFMNLLCLPLRQPAEPRRVGTTMEIALPSGYYEAMWCHEEALGGYWSISLFSPMGEFPDMATAVETADATLEVLFSAAEMPSRAQFMEERVQPAPARTVEARLADQAAASCEGDDAGVDIDTDTDTGIGTCMDVGMEAQTGTAEMTKDVPDPAAFSRRDLFGLRSDNRLS